MNRLYKAWKTTPPFPDNAMPRGQIFGTLKSVRVLAGTSASGEHAHGSFQIRSPLRLTRYGLRASSGVPQGQGPS